MSFLRPSDCTSAQLLSFFLECSADRLRDFIEPDRAHEFYTAKRVQKRRRRGPRVVYLVDAELRRVHRAIATTLRHSQQARDLDARVQGYTRGRDILSNAKLHCGKEWVVTADVANFFDSITIDRVRAVFLNVGFPAQASQTLASLCTMNGKLIQGGRASPIISNLAVLDLDDSLVTLVPSSSTYSRYADDLTFSGDDVPTEPMISAALVKHGFELRPGSFSLCRGAAGPVVTGLNVGAASPRIPRRIRRQIDRDTRCLAHFGLDWYAKKKETTRAHAFNELSGRIFGYGRIESDWQEIWLSRLQSETIAAEDDPE